MFFSYCFHKSISLSLPYIYGHMSPPYSSTILCIWLLLFVSYEQFSGYYYTIIIRGLLGFVFPAHGFYSVILLVHLSDIGYLLGLNFLLFPIFFCFWKLRLSTFRHSTMYLNRERKDWVRTKEDDLKAPKNVQNTRFHQQE